MAQHDHDQGLGGEIRRGRERCSGAEPPASSEHPTHHLLGLIVLDVLLIVDASAGLVEAAIGLGNRWHISQAILGVLVLGPLTSIPNAATGIRLGRAGRSSALVGETFNSNSINLGFGVIVPALFVTLAKPSSSGRLGLAWLIVMTAYTLLVLATRRGMRRDGAAALIAMYAGFVVVQLVSG